MRRGMLFHCIESCTTIKQDVHYVVLLGFGSANQALAQLLLQKAEHINNNKQGKEILISGFSPARTVAAGTLASKAWTSILLWPISKT